MTKPRSQNQFRFPFKFEKNGRTGKIYKLGNGTFKSAFTFAGSPKQNTFKTPQAALEYLDAEFSKLDTQRENALSLHPLNGNVKDYAELEQLLRDEGSGATLREAVSFYIAHHKTKRFKAMRVLHRDSRHSHVERPIAANPRATPPVGGLALPARP
jgi:hypothetical protein